MASTRGGNGEVMGAIGRFWRAGSKLKEMTCKNRMGLT